MSASLTICLLNYRRPRNVVQIVHALSTQNVAARLFLWDNAPVLQSLANHALIAKSVDWYVRSNRNILCPPRWWMASQADTDYVMTLDDDLLPTDRRVLSDLLDAAAGEMPDRVIGPFGTVLTGPNYFPHEDVHCPTRPRTVDVIKGRLMLVCTEGLRCHVRLGDLCGILGAEEDIAVCGALARSRRHRHLVPGGFRGRLKELPAPGALEKRPDHAARRNAARKHWFPL